MAIASILMAPFELPVPFLAVTHEPPSAAGDGKVVFHFWQHNDPLPCGHMTWRRCPDLKQLYFPKTSGALI